MNSKLIVLIYTFTLRVYDDAIYTDLDRLVDGREKIPKGNARNSSVG